MPRFTFFVCREMVQSAQVTIEADSIGQAHEKGLELARTDAELKWGDDGPDGVYLPDPDDYQEESDADN